MTKLELPPSDFLDENALSVTGQLQLFSISIEEANWSIVHRLARQACGFSSLVLKSAEGESTHIVAKLDNKNIVMLQDLYDQLGANTVDAKPEGFYSPGELSYRRPIPLPDGVVLVESYNQNGGWSSFNVKAYSPNDAIDMGLNAIE